MLLGSSQCEFRSLSGVTHQCSHVCISRFLMSRSLVMFIQTEKNTLHATRLLAISRIDYCNALLRVRVESASDGAECGAASKPKRRLHPLEQSCSSPCYPSSTAFRAACVQMRQSRLFSYLVPWWWNDLMSTLKSWTTPPPRPKASWRPSSP